MLLALAIKRRQDLAAAAPGEPLRPVDDVGAIPNAIGPPAIIRVADEEVVLSQCPAQTTVGVSEPVLTTRMMDEHKLDRVFRASLRKRLRVKRARRTANSRANAYQQARGEGRPRPTLDSRLSKRASGIDIGLLLIACVTGISMSRMRSASCVVPLSQRPGDACNGRWRA